MAHPLDGAFLHLDGADNDFRELKSVLDEFVRENQDKAISNYDLASTHGLSVLEVSSRVRLFDEPEVSPRASVLVGTIVYHLRAALDYLVYELAVNDSGVIQHGTQFIIEDVKADPKNRSYGFDARAKSKLCGLSPAHIAMIESIQPYNGVTWTEILRDLSNSDKHRKLTVIESSNFVSHDVRIGEEGSFKGELGTTLRRIGGGKEIHIKAESMVYVGFAERNYIPVLKTLDGIKREVRSLIDSFKPEF